MIDQLTFDITDANSQNDTHQVGAVVQGVRSGNKELINSTQINSLEWLNTVSVLYDENGAVINDSNPLPVNLTDSITVEVDLDHTNDSIALGDGTNLLTSTTIGADIGLDVNVINTTLAVTQSGAWSVGITGDVNVTQGTSPWVISATDLDIRDLVYTQDSVTAYQGGTWNIGTLTSITNDVNIADGGNSITVDAIDFDIRDLSASQDNVAISDGTDTLAINTDGSINTLAGAFSSIANGKTTLASANTAQDVVGSPLANRKELWLYNNDNRKMYIGATGVAAASGFPVSPGSYVILKAGPSVDIEYVSAKASHDLRYLEQAS